MRYGRPGKYRIYKTNMSSGNVPEKLQDLFRAIIQEEWTFLDDPWPMYPKTRRAHRSEFKVIKGMCNRLYNISSVTTPTTQPHNHPITQPPPTTLTTPPPSRHQYINTLTPSRINSSIAPSLVPTLDSTHFVSCCCSMRHMKLAVMSKLGAVAVYFFLTVLWNKVYFPGPYKALEKGIAFLYFFVSGESMESMSVFMARSSFYEIFRTFFKEERSLFN